MMPKRGREIGKKRRDERASGEDKGIREEAAEGKTGQPRMAAGNGGNRAVAKCRIREGDE